MVTPQLPRHPVLAFLRHSTLYAHTVSQFMCMYLLAGRAVSVGFTNNDIHIALLHQEIKRDREDIFDIFLKMYTVDLSL